MASNSIAYFWVNSAGFSGEFDVVFRYFQNLENLILNIFRGKIAYPLACGLYFPEIRVKLLE